MAKKKRKWNPVPLISSALRRIWAWSPLRKDALKLAGNACEECGAAGKEVKLEVHHVEPVNMTQEAHRIAKKLFPPIEGLDVLCKGCHDKLHREGK